MLLKRNTIKLNHSFKDGKLKPIRLMKLILSKESVPLITLFFYAILGFSQQELVVTKPVKSGNPKLSIVAFQGGNQAVKLLKNSVYYSNWFDLIDSNDADYFLSGSLKQEPGASVIHVEVTDNNGAGVTNFELRSEAKTALKVLVNKAVDETISQIFKTPGFCSSNIAFVKELNGEKEVWIADFDGDNPRQFTYDNNISVEPAWSRKNKYLVYTFYNNSSTDLILIDMINRKRKRLTRFPGINCGAAFANNVRQVAMTLSKDRNVDLYLVDLASGKLRRVTKTAGAEASPCWSPDDSRICYVSDEGGTRPTLYLVPSSGGRATRLLKLPVEAVSPDWSPVSNKICFSMGSKGHYTIAVVDMKSNLREPEVLVTADGDWESPSWAADGRHIVCSRSFKGEKALHLVDSYYKKIIPLKNYSGNDTLPSYSDVVR